ncbi:protein of unknown function [Streptantibioticus cattleyicolor NRRL 8057 = DSM 46488]|nr:protein of unknown function [Streptantibioticus cattleyicolor NRRL 8057 = DSM 46488]
MTLRSARNPETFRPSAYSWWTRTTVSASSAVSGADCGPCAPSRAVSSGPSPPRTCARRARNSGCAPSWCARTRGAGVSVCDSRTVPVLQVLRACPGLDVRALEGEPRARQLRTGGAPPLGHGAGGAGMSTAADWARGYWCQVIYDQLREGAPFTLVTTDPTGRYVLVAWSADVPCPAAAYSAVCATVGSRPAVPRTARGEQPWARRRTPFPPRRTPSGGTPGSSQCNPNLDGSDCAPAETPACDPSIEES